MPQRILRKCESLFCSGKRGPVQVFPARQRGNLWSTQFFQIRELLIAAEERSNCDGESAKSLKRIFLKVKEIVYYNRREDFESKRKKPFHGKMWIWKRKQDKRKLWSLVTRGNQKELNIIINKEKGTDTK